RRPLIVSGTLRGAYYPKIWHSVQIGTSRQSPHPTRRARFAPKPAILPTQRGRPTDLCHAASEFGRYIRPFFSAPAYSPGPDHLPSMLRAGDRLRTGDLRLGRTAL